MKNNKGITLQVLILTIIIMMILAGVSINIGFSMNKNILMKEVSTNLLLIKAKIQTIAEKHNFDNANELIGEKITTENITDEINNLIGNGVITLNNIDEEEIYLLTQDNLNEFGLETLNADDGYLVNYTNNEVIYIKGVQNEENNIVYKLSDMV